MTTNADWLPNIAYTMIFVGLALIAYAAFLPRDDDWDDFID